MSVNQRHIGRVCATGVGIALALGVAGARVPGAWAQQAVAGTGAGASLSVASPGAQLWVKRYNSHGNGGAESVAVSPNGNTVFVTGYTTLSSGTENYTTIAYKAATGAQLWIKGYAGLGALNRAVSVAVSPNGKAVFVTGETGSASYGYGASYATVAYNAITGAQLWAKRYGTPADGDSFAAEVAVSPNGKTVFVTGNSANSYQAGGGFDYATVAYNAATGAQLWAKRYADDTSQVGIGAQAVAVSPNGSTLYVTGNSSAGNGEEYATIAYKSATGAQLWLRYYPGVAYSGGAAAMAVSPSGKTVIVTGSVDAGNTAEYATVAYNAVTGVQLWAKRYGTPGSDEAYAVAVSPNGRTVFVTGTIATANNTGAKFEYTTIAYDAATGARLWVKVYDGGDEASGYDDNAYAVAVSPDGKAVYITGGSGDGYYATTVAYNAATGAQLWVRSYNGGDYGDQAAAVAVSPTTGRVFVTGDSGNSAFAYLTIAYQG